MTTTGGRDLLAVAATCAILAWLAVGQWYGLMPPIRPLATAPLLPVAAIEAYWAVVIRRRTAEREAWRRAASNSGAGHRPPTGSAPPPPLDPLLVSRALVLAKASSLLGAVLGGAWFGVAGSVYPRAVTLLAAAADRVGIAAGLLTGISLAGAGLFLERSCRVPPPPEGLQPG